MLNQLLRNCSIRRMIFLRLPMLPVSFYRFLCIQKSRAQRSEKYVAQFENFMNERCYSIAVIPTLGRGDTLADTVCDGLLQLEQAHTVEFRFCGQIDSHLLI